MEVSGVAAGPDQVKAGTAIRRIAIIADDLTGACDTAVAFAGAYAEVRVALTDVLPAVNGVSAISTDTRDLDPETCEARLCAQFGRIAPDTEILKKVDSAFRGNTTLEIATALRCFPDRLAIVAPAYPVLGREMIGGKLLIRDLNRVREVDVRAQLAGLGCRTASLPLSADRDSLCREMAEIEKLGASALLCDATETAHLETLVRAARAQSRPVLWIGSAGLAHALAAELPPISAREDQARSSGQCIFFIGSNHAVTRGQALHLQRLTGLALARCTASAEAGGDGLMLSVPRGESEANIRDAVSRLDAWGIGCLFMTGGDTARLVCRALGINAIRLHREFVPGVPLGTAEGGRFDGVPVLLKSGAFGSRNLMRDVYEVFADRKDTICA